MDDNPNTDESCPHKDGSQFEDADAAANRNDSQTPSYWTTGKNDIRSEAEIIGEAVASHGGACNHDEQIKRADAAESNNATGGTAQIHKADFNDANASVTDRIAQSKDTPASDSNANDVLAPRAITPEEFTGLRVTAPHTHAAGLPSIISTMRHALGEMGLIRTTRTLLVMNQNGGFDCQSCAWPDPDGARHFAEFCENGAKAVADEATKKRVTPDFFREWSVAELSLKSDYWLGKQGRITHPMVLPKGATHYEPISWEAAFDMLAVELNNLDSPDEALFYCSGRASNEAAFLYQLFVRQYGTNNLPDCSNMCHESSGTALMEAIGIGKGTVTLDDFEKCDLIIITGQNPGTNHPRMLTSLERAKHRGAKIIAINPLPEAGLLGVVNPNPQEHSNPLKFSAALLGNQSTALADLHLPVRIGGDMAVLKGMMKVLFDIEAEHPGTVLDRAFIEHDTSGFDDFRRTLDLTTWEQIAAQSGLSRYLIRQAGEMYARAGSVITCWAMGLTQHKHAVATIQEIANLHFLRGQIGKPGMGLCPVRGHSNVQGDRTMGIWERPREAFLAKLDEVFCMKSPRHHGYDTVEGIRAMYVNRAKVFFALGGNFLSATPDTNYTAKALRRCSLTAQVITKLNRTALITGGQSLILPCLGRSEKDEQAAGEQFVSCENSMGVVQMSQGILKPGSEHLRSEPWIVANLARRTLMNRTRVDWQAMAANYDQIRNAIERTIPGFDDYNRRVREPGGFYLPNDPREGRFPTATGKAVFTSHELPDLKLLPGELIMMTIRTHDQFNTTIYGLEDRYRGIHNERRVVLMNKEDMRENNLRAGQVVDLTSYFDEETGETSERRAPHFIVVPYDIPARCAATYFPETNVLVPINSTAERSNTPVSKFIRIRITPHVGAGEGSVGKFDYDHTSPTEQIHTLKDL